MKQLKKQELNGWAHNAIKLGSFGWLMGIMLVALSSLAWATPRNTDPIWRAQIRLQVSDVSGAGTDDPIEVKLSRTYGNHTQLDYGQDDFERNSTFTYDLNLIGLEGFGWFDQISITKPGQDGVYIKSLALLINNKSVFRKTFAGNGFWLESPGSPYAALVIPLAEVQQHPDWLAYVQPAQPQTFSASELASRIESQWGEIMILKPDSHLAWGPKFGTSYVEITAPRAAENMLHVDLDLEADVFGPNPEVDVDYDLRLICVAGRLALKAENFQFHVASATWFEWMTGRLIVFFDEHNQEVLESQSMGMIVHRLGNLSCTNWVAAPNGNLVKINNGQIIPTQVLSGAISDDIAPPTQAVVAEFNAPYQVSIETGKETQPGAASDFTVSVLAQNGEATTAEVQLELPARINLAEALVMITDGQKTRTLSPQVLPCDKGGTLLRFTDTFTSKNEMRYTVKLIALTGMNEQLGIHSTVNVSGATAPIKSTSILQLDNSRLLLLGTVHHTAPTPVKAEASGREPVGEISETIKR